MCSADQIGVVVEFVSETTIDLEESLLVNHTTGISWTLWQIVSHFHVSESLHLMNSGNRCVLLTVVKWVIFLWHLKSKHWVANADGENNEDTHERSDLGSLKLVMHSSNWIWQFVVKIFVNVSNGMGEVVMEIVCIHIVVVNEHSSVLLLWLEIKSHIVPVGWPHFVVWMGSMSEVFWDWHWQGSGLHQGHLTLEVLIVTSVVITVSVDNTDAGGLQHREWLVDRSLGSEQVH